MLDFTFCPPNLFPNFRLGQPLSPQAPNNIKPVEQVHWRIGVFVSIALNRKPIRITCADKTRHFLNMAGAGFDAHVVRLVQTRGDRHWRYITGLLQGAHNFQAPELTISAAGFRHEGPTLVAFLNIGRYLGGGMRVAPQAQFDDGLFELTVVRSMRLPRLLANLPRLALDNLASSHLVSVARAASVSIEGDTLIEADGELLGRTPANFRIIARAMRVVVPRPDKHAQF